MHAVAKVQTGIAKGKKPNGESISLPYLRVANVQDGYLDLSEVKRIEVSPKDVNRYLLREGDVLLTEGGDFDKLGRGHIWQGELPVCLHQNHIFAVRTDRRVLDPRFFAALAASSYGKRYFLSCAKQTTNLASINSTQLREFPVPLPPLPEQRKIAEILGTWDEAIALLERRIAAARERKKGLMQRLLTGQVRFPGFAEPWREVRLGEVAQVIMGQSPSSEHYNTDNEGLPLIQGNGDISNRRTAPKLYTRQITKRCRIGDIVLSVRAPVGETARAMHTACIGRGVCAIRPRLANDDFLYQLLVFLEPMWQRLAQGSTFTAINGSDIRQVGLQMPGELPEQQRIAHTLSACDEEVELLTRKLVALQEQKKGLMQPLLTGKVRVVP